jgi:hypothetical protein
MKNKWTNICEKKIITYPKRIEYNDCVLFTLLLTSLLGKIRLGANDDDDVSSIVLDDICVEELLNPPGINVIDGIWTLFFLSNGLRGGKAGGRSWLVDCIVDPVERLFCLCDDEEDFVDNKDIFGEFLCSSSIIAFASTVDGPCLLRPGFRLN